MSPEEQQAAADVARRQQIASLADQARDSAIGALRGQIERAPLPVPAAYAAHLAAIREAQGSV